MPHVARFSRIFLRKTKSRIVETIREILMKPNNGVMLVGPLRGLWKARVGKYRIIYEINEKEKAVVFHDIELRKKVYK